MPLSLHVHHTLSLMHITILVVPVIYFYFVQEIETVGDLKMLFLGTLIIARLLCVRAGEAGGPIKVKETRCHG